MDKEKVLDGVQRDKNGLIVRDEGWRKRMGNANNAANKKKFVPVREQKKKLEKPERGEK